MPEGMLEEEIDEEDLEETVANVIHVGAEDFFDATRIAMEILSEFFESEEDYEIRSVKEMYGINVVNWAGENEPCDCPYCKAERMADEDLMHFDCPICKNIVKVADGEWEDIQCRECGTTIQRDRIIDIGRGKYKVIIINK